VGEQTFVFVLMGGRPQPLVEDTVGRSGVGQDLRQLSGIFCEDLVDCLDEGES
jgi:hypothetical protein